MSPTFSIVTVCLNNLAGLKATAETVTAQTWEQYEWLVIDGGSTDGTVEWMESQELPMLRWVSGKDRGLYDAMNIGLELAKNDYLIFMNSGDLFADPSVIEHVAHELSTSTADIVYGDAIEFDDSGSYYKRASSYRWVSYSMFTHHQSIFYKRSAIGETRYDLSYRISADWVLTATLLNNGASALYLKIPISRFQRGGLSTSDGARLQAREELYRLHREILKSGLTGKALIFLKLTINNIRRRWPHLYDRVRLKPSN